MTRAIRVDFNLDRRDIINTTREWSKGAEAIKLVNAKLQTRTISIVTKREFL